MYSGSFEGYASVFHNIDFDGDVICPGAFYKTLTQLREQGTPLPVLWQHDPKKPIGICIQLQEPPHGLWVIGHLDPDKGQGAYAALQHGQLNALSIGYRPRKTHRNHRVDIRYITGLDLYEISLVARAANPMARVTWVTSPLNKASFTKNTFLCEKR